MRQNAFIALAIAGSFYGDEGLKIANSMSLDLVEISPKTEPPVCKIIDYKKFIYDQKKKQKAIKSKAVKVVVKELRFGPNTGEHDFDFKLKHAIKFLHVFIFHFYENALLAGKSFPLENSISFLALGY